jgi:hypothetical protein
MFAIAIQQLDRPLPQLYCMYIRDFLKKCAPQLQIRISVIAVFQQSATPSRQLLKRNVAQQMHIRTAALDF